MTGLIARITHLPSTLSGLGVAAVVGYALTSFHCQVPSDWLTWGVTALSALPGLLARK